MASSLANRRFLRSLGRIVVPGLLIGLLGMASQAMAADAGRRIYEEGVLSNGQLLTGVRQNSTIQAGAVSACSNCHRPSGMGSVEGEVQTPPITGNALFGTGDRVIATMDPRTGKAFNQRHEPYSEKDIETLLRTGRYPDGREASPVMPRYNLAAADMRLLIDYLKGLSVQWSPGVSADSIRIATIVTPDVDPKKIAIFKEMVTKIVHQKNGSTKVAGPATRHHMTSAAELVLGTERRWVMDIWELQGPPESWQAQLTALYEKSPVFAVVSGLGGRNWAPVDAFCDRMALPCWFPSVADAPSNPKYTLYFNAGLQLEARVLAQHWRDDKTSRPAHVLQVRADDAAAAGASRALQAALSSMGLDTRERVLAAVDRQTLNDAISSAGPHDAVVLWLSAADLTQLEDVPVIDGRVWISGSFGADEATAIPQNWRKAVRVIYPYELPEQRSANLAYFKAWLVQRQLPLIDETMQSEVFFAFSFFTDTVAEMLDNLYREYLVERAESMIDRRELSRAESEYFSSTSSHVRLIDKTGESSADVKGPVALKSIRHAGAGFLQRGGTTVYPRLTLGAGQRFASKGAYLVHFGSDGQVIPETEWIVP